MENLICLFCGLLGVASHVFISYRTLCGEAKRKGVGLPFKRYFKNDWPGTAMAVISVVVWMLVFDEAVGFLGEQIREFVRLSFILVGLSGSYLLQKAMSVSRSYIDRTAKAIEKSEDRNV